MKIIMTNPPGPGDHHGKERNIYFTYSRICLRFQRGKHSKNIDKIGAEDLYRLDANNRRDLYQKLMNTNELSRSLSKVNTTD